MARPSRLPLESDAVALAVYFTPRASALFGVKVAVLLAPSYVTVPATAVFDESLRVNTIDELFTASENVADGVTDAGTLDALSIGLCDVTDGGVVSGAVPVWNTASTQ